MLVRRINVCPVPDGVEVFLEPVKEPISVVNGLGGVRVVDCVYFTAVGSESESYWYTVSPCVNVSRIVNVWSWSKDSSVKVIPRYLVTVPSVPEELRCGLYITDLSRRVMYSLAFLYESSIIVSTHGKLEKIAQRLENRTFLSHAFAFAYAHAIARLGKRWENPRDLEYQGLGISNLVAVDKTFYGGAELWVGPDRAVFVRNGKPIVGYKVPTTPDGDRTLMYYIEKLLRGIRVKIIDRGSHVLVTVMFPEVDVTVKVNERGALLYDPVLGIVKVV